MTNAVSIAQSGSNNTTFRNRIINGAMMIDQRNAGASLTIPASTSTYTVDRWGFQASQASKLTAQQNAGSVTPPVGFSNYLGYTVGASANVTLGASDYFNPYHRIEGFNFADLGWGTANAATITLSFWVRCSLTGTFSGALQNSASTRSYPFTFAISSANTWEQKNITIAGDTSGTWVGATNGIGVSLYFNLGSGSTYLGTAGAWSGAAYVGVTGSVTPITTNSATFYITGVQLEKGSTASPFEYRPYGTELQLCFRYCQSYTTTSGQLSFAAFAQSSTIAISYQLLNTPMRSAPTTGSIIGATAGNWNFSIGGGSDMTASSMSVLDLSSSSYAVQLTCASSSVVAGQGGRIRTSASGYGILLSAEL